MHMYQLVIVVATQISPLGEVNAYKDNYVATVVGIRFLYNSLCQNGDPCCLTVTVSRLVHIVSTDTLPKGYYI